MLSIHQTVDNNLITLDDLTEKGIWINLTDPTSDEIEKVSAATGMQLDMLKAALDDEERSRMEVDDDQLLILINVPISEGTERGLVYDTLPLGIIVNHNAIATVCLRQNPVMIDFEHSKPRGLYTFKKTRFVLQVLYKAASYYLRYLLQIDKKSSEIENQLHKSTKNEELIKLFNLSKSLVYFRTSLRANEIVMEKLLRSQWMKADPESEVTSQLLKMYPEDEELLEDVIIENKQALEMSETYSNVLSGMMDAFASVISNNLNIVMKFLTSVTIILALPTMVASFYGMNVSLPFQASPFAFLGIMLASVALSTAGVIFLMRKNMF